MFTSVTKLNSPR